MLDGLKAAEISFSELEKTALVLGADFYHPDKNRALKKMRGGVAVGDCFQQKANMVKEIAGPAVCYDLSDAITNCFEKTGATDVIGSAKKTALAGDFVISRLRSYLREMAIVPGIKERQIFSSEFLVYRKSADSPISAETLMAFCMSSHVQTILRHSQYGTEHPRFYDFLIGGLSVPDAVININSGVTEMILNSHKHGERARHKYAGAEHALMKHLGLHEWRPQQGNIAVKTFGDSVRASGRWDAEYYQPKYDSVVRAVKNNRRGFVVVGDAVRVKNANFVPQKDKDYDYIELANITPTGETRGCSAMRGENLPTRARRMVKTGDVIVSSVEGSLSGIALVGADYNNALCSTGFHVIDSGSFNPETLLLLFRSVIGQLQLERGCSGTILTAINTDEFNKIVLPVVGADMQANIKNTIAETQRLRARSKELLDNARQAVEIAIEKGEKEALAFLEERAKK